MAQWLDRVKFGNGSDGSPAISTLDSNTGMGFNLLTGTSGSTSVSVTDCYAGWRIENGDPILIHQSQGTGAGQWEINVANETFGTGTKSVKYPLTYTYSTGCQVCRIPQFTGGTLSSAIEPISGWNGNWGGIIALMCNGDLTISGSLTVNGSNATGAAGATSVGFKGGANEGENDRAFQGDGYSAVGGESVNANGNGGGGGFHNDNSGKGASGGGGGNGTAGTSGVNGGNGTVAGTGGATSGNAGLTSMVFGGGGGGGASYGQDAGGGGGSAGGIVVIIAKSITVSGGITSNGGDGYSGSGSQSAGGGGGAGGSILIKANTATLGTNIITANAGAGGNGTYDGGAGGVGRIHIDYYSTYTGSTTPTIDATQDTNLKSVIYSGMI